MLHDFRAVAVARTRGLLHEARLLIRSDQGPETIPIVESAVPKVGYAEGGVEPPIDDLLRDPIISLRAQADGLSLADVEQVVVVAKTRLRDGPEASPATCCAATQRPRGSQPRTPSRARLM